MDDQSLARALLARDRRAPKEAWVRFTPMVRAIVVRGLGPDGEVEDLIQEIYCRLFAKIGTLRRPEALRQFIASFAVRNVKWEQRRRRMRRRVKLTTTGVIPDCPVEAPLSYDVWDACQLCDKLLPRQRAVMFLRYAEGMTVAEIAQALRLSVATIKRALQAAQLRVSSLNPRGAEPGPRRHS